MNGFREPAKRDAWAQELPLDGKTPEPHFITLPSAEVLTSSVHNHLGLNVLRTWPTLYDGTRTPHNIPSWWQLSDKVDVLICGGKHFLATSAGGS
jgi:phenol 2-monooxygenase (NADPH)